MDYTEVDITVQPPTQANRDIITALLAQIGYESFEDTRKGLKAYIPTNLYDRPELNNTLENLNSVFDTLNFSVSTIEDRNWNAEWEKNFTPIIIKDKCCIRAPFHSERSDLEYDLIIEPKMSFGTGHHETTALMVEHMLDMDFSGKRVLDMGCGTGVLGILASKKGADSVVAIDIDNWSYENTIENAQRNSINNIEVILGGAEKIGNKTFDIIIANINRNILLNDMPEYVKALNTKGVILFSGFYTHDLDSIDNKADELNLEYIYHLENNNWVASKYINKAKK